MNPRRIAWAVVAGLAAGLAVRFARQFPWALSGVVALAVGILVLALHGQPTAQETARKGSRLAYFPEHAGYVSVDVYDRYRLAPGSVLDGPVIVEERESTTIVAPGGRLVVDPSLNLVIELSERV